MPWKGWRYDLVPEADSGRIGAREETLILADCIVKGMYAADKTLVLA